MSPSEQELRAALRRGEGQAPDPAGLIAHARGVRRQRRARTMSAAAAVIVVGSVAGGGAWLGHDRSNPSAVAGPDHAAGAHRSVPNLGGSMTPISHGPLRSSGGTSLRPQPQPRSQGCSARPVQYLLPGGGSSQFGADDALVNKPVRSALVCVYLPGPDGQLGYSRSLSFTGSTATELADSLNQPDARISGQPCAVVKPGTFVVHLVATDGSRLTPVTITMNSCNFRATNGTALRTSWEPPGGLYATLRDALNSGTISLAPGRYPTASGSPVH